MNLGSMLRNVVIEQWSEIFGRCIIFLIKIIKDPPSSGESRLRLA